MQLLVSGAGLALSVGMLASGRGEASVYLPLLTSIIGYWLPAPRRAAPAVAAASAPAPAPAPAPAASATVPAAVVYYSSQLAVRPVDAEELSAQDSASSINNN